MGSDLFLIFYFFLLFWIASYGIHLYWLIFIYLKNRKRSDATIPLADIYDSELPLVTIQLPVYNERFVVERLIKAVSNFDYPPDRFEIQVLDDSTDDTTAIIGTVMKQVEEMGVTITHLHRDHRRGYKAGALADGLSIARGEFIAIFDSDNIPRVDFLQKLIGRFSDPTIGMVQARWSFINRDQSLLCRAQALFLDAHFLIEQAARSYGNLFMNFNGTAGIWRKRAIIEAGGWQSDTLTEDLDLSYRAQMAGWKMIFVEAVDVPTELPASIRSFKSQQYRWARGAVETGLKVLPNLYRKRFPYRVKLAATFHLTHKSVSLALLLLAVMLVPALYLRLESGLLKILLVDLPIFLAGTGSMSLFYGLAYRRQKKIRTTKNLLLLPAMTSLGVALSINNSLAIFSALFGSHQTPEFVRTPKTGTSGENKSHPSPVSSDYKIKFDRTMVIEIGLALYALVAIGYAGWLGLYFSMPFLATFAFGFMYYGLRSLGEHFA